MIKRMPVSAEMIVIEKPEKPLLLADFVNLRRKRTWLRNFKKTFKRNLVYISHNPIGTFLLEAKSSVTEFSSLNMERDETY